MADLTPNPIVPKGVTPRQQALLANEEVFRHVFDCSAIGMALVSIDGIYLKVNQMLCAITGYEEDELIQLHYKEITYPDDLEEDLKLMKLTLQGMRNSYQLEKRFVHKNGSLIWAILSVSLIRDGSDIPLYFVSQFQDITDRKLAEQKLEESRQRYKSLVRHNPDIVCMLDENGKLISANPAALRITGYSKEEILGRSFIPYIVPDDWKISWNLFTRAKAGEVLSAQINIIHKQGHTVALEASCVPIITHHELNGMYLIAKDVTKRKQNEAMIDRLNNKNKLILSAVSDGIFGIDDKLETIFWNEAAAKMTGYSYEEMIKKNAYEILKHTDSEGTPYSKENSPLYQSLYEGVYFHIANEAFRKKTGEPFPVEYITSPIYEDGRIIGAVVTFKDITERKRTEELLRKSEKLSMVGQIAAGVAHEIRNPLTALKGFTQFLRSGAANKQEYYEVMLSELNRIELIVSEMLVLAKPHMTRYHPKHMETILENVVALVETQAILNDIQFVLVIERGLPLVLCEENQLKQLIINLLKNAMESMLGGGQIDIHLHAEEQNHIKIVLKDQGEGIPTEILERLGEPFFTTKDNGTGLGVMISYKIIEDHKGTMHIDSQVGIGTTVTLTLPVIQDRTKGEQ